MWLIRCGIKECGKRKKRGLMEEKSHRWEKEGGWEEKEIDGWIKWLTGTQYVKLISLLFNNFTLVFNESAVLLRSSMHDIST